MKKISVSTLLGLALSLGAFAQQEHLSIGSYSGQSEITALKSVTLTNGFHIPSGSNVRLYLLSAPFLTSAPSSSQNYILTRTFRKPVKASDLGSARSIKDENQSVQYFDGLGRPLQNVELMASPAYKDIVQHIEYDGFGRESKKYLPYAEQSSANGSFKTIAAANQKAYYASTGSWDAHVAKTTRPYSETVFENSPLNRVKEQGAPGEVWQPGGARTTTGGRTVVMDYGTNVTTTLEAVKLWKPTYDASGNPTGATGTTNYLAGKLYKTVLKDENWTNGKTGTVEEYKDFEDRVVLKRVWESESKKLDTYYAYDDFGDLCYVVPPAVGASSFTTQSSDANFENYIYGYKYDGRRRLVEKKIPGKGWEHIVYNRNDQPVLTQDAIQRGAGKWSYTKYDAFGRVTESGIFSRNLSRTVLQDTLNAETANGTSIALWESRPRHTPSYDNKSYPRVGSTKTVLQINYYDDYGFKTPTVLPATSGLDSTSRVRGLLTGSKVSRDDGTSPLLTVNYYDERARLIQSMSDNHLSGTDRITNTYSFVGELETSTRVHIANGLTTTTVTTNEYDHVGRLSATKHKVNAQAEVILAKNDYNEIGQLKQKKQHSENNGTNFINSTEYTYNERGWLLRSASDYFTQSLRYNTEGVPQYNGNISRQIWRFGLVPAPTSTFDYSYDPLNRLKAGVSTGTVMSEAITYDDMGNITNLKRDGHATGTTYAYTGNKLKSLGGELGTTADLLYDANGNATRDRRGMTMSYNYLNLPKTATITGTSVAYLYDAMGTKLRKTATVGSVTTQRDYVAGIEYSKVGTGASAIEMIHIPEGYIERNSGNVYTYHYNLTDHLGNVRATLQRTSATAGTVIQKHDYYPFGKAKAIVVSGKNKYLYNGKEIQGELGDQYDYGARFYDAEIGRWNVVDRFAEKYSSLSPYQYGELNPIINIDINGDSTWTSVRESYSNGKKTTFNTIHIRGKVLNASSSQADLHGLASSITSKLNSQKQSFTYSSGETNVYNIDAQYTFARSAKDVSPSDHLLVMVDKILGKVDGEYGDRNVAGLAEIGGKVAYVTKNINSGIVGGSMHEIGHNFGLGDVTKGSIDDHSGNVMSYNATASAGYLYNDMATIYRNAKAGFSNRGVNRMQINNSLPRTNSTSTSGSPYIGNRYYNMIIPKPLTR